MNMRGPHSVYDLTEQQYMTTCFVLHYELCKCIMVDHYDLQP